jgi:hypothetical protein
MRVTQQQIELECEAAKTRYMLVDKEQARVNFSYEIHGFISSEMERGLRLSDAVVKILELLNILVEAPK